MSSSLAERGCNRLVFPFLRDPTDRTVVIGESVDLGLDQCEITLVRIVFPVLLKVPRRINRPAQKCVEIFWNLQPLLFGNKLLQPFVGNLGNKWYPITVSQNLTNNAWRIALFR